MQGYFSSRGRNVNLEISLQNQSCLDYLSRCPGCVCEAFEFWLASKFFRLDQEEGIRTAVFHALSNRAAA